MMGEDADGTVGSSTGTDARLQRDRPAVAFSVEIGGIEECGTTCRQVTLALTNTGKKDAHGVAVDARVSARGNVLWTGEEQVGRLAAGETYAEERRIELGPDDIVAVQRNDGVVTLQLVIDSDETSRVLSQAVDVRNNEAVETPIPALREGRTRTVQHEGQEFLVVDRIPNQPPNRYAVTTPDYTLAPVDRTRDVLAKDFWPTITWDRDWGTELDTTVELRQSERNNRTFGKMLDLGWDFTEILILMSIGAPQMAIGPAIDAATDAIGWTIEAVETPYREAFQKMSGSLATSRTVDELAGGLTSYTNAGDGLQRLFDAYSLVGDALSNGADLAQSWSQLISTIRAGSGSLNAALKPALNASRGIFLGLALSTTVGQLESAIKTKAGVHSVGYAMATVRIPLLKRIRFQQDLLDSGEFVIGDAIKYYLNLQSDYQLLALGHAGVAKYWQAVSDLNTGFLWDIIGNADGRAQEARQRSQTYLETARTVGGIFGQANNKIETMTRQSVNGALMGGSQ